MIMINALIDYRKKIPNGHCLCFTANSIVNNGNLVMGAGNALQMKINKPGIDSKLGSMIDYGDKFGFVTTEIDSGLVGAFQTKIHWRKESTLELISISTNKLLDFCDSRKGMSFHLPMPGVSNGGLDFDEVLEVIKSLPDNVYVYCGA